MNEEHDYRAIAERIEDNEIDVSVDGPAIMALLKCETRWRNGVAEYQAPGQSDWKQCPRFDSADDFEVWVLQTRKGCLDDIGRNDDGITYYASYNDDEYGNDYGQSTRLGSAMWAAFVYLVGKVDRPE